MCNVTIIFFLLLLLGGLKLALFKLSHELKIFIEIFELALEVLT